MILPDLLQNLCWQQIFVVQNLLTAKKYADDEHTMLACIDYYSRVN